MPILEVQSAAKKSDNIITAVKEKTGIFSSIRTVLYSFSPQDKGLKLDS